MSAAELPLKLNQWSNVVRWELRTRPFLRSSEFLWQEGHTAHGSAACARRTARQMLGVYGDFAEGVLAVPVVRGAKSPRERFAGADALTRLLLVFVPLFNYVAVWLVITPRLVRFYEHSTSLWQRAVGNTTGKKKQ